MKKLTLLIMLIFAFALTWASDPSSAVTTKPKSKYSHSYEDSCFPPFHPDDPEIIEVEKITESLIHKLRWNTIFAMATDGKVDFGIGLSNFYFEAGAVCSIHLIARRNESNMYSPGLFIGARYFPSMRTILSFGAYVNETFGKINYRNVHFSISTGAYAAISRFLTNNVMLAFRVNAYHFQYEKLQGLETQLSHRIVNSGGLGLSYLF